MYKRPQTGPAQLLAQQIAQRANPAKRKKKRKGTGFTERMGAIGAVKSGNATPSQFPHLRRGR